MFYTFCIFNFINTGRYISRQNRVKVNIHAKLKSFNSLLEKMLRINVLFFLVNCLLKNKFNIHVYLYI